jgi:hypothetical protein
LDRVFTDPFLDLLRISLVVLGAFLAGGIVQRVWMADFRFKAGPLELKEVLRRRVVESQTADGVDILTAAIEKLRADVKKNELGSIEAVKKLAEAVEKEIGEMKTQVASLQAGLPPEPPGE